MTRIDLDSRWYRTKESVDNILAQYKDALREIGTLISFIDTINRAVYVRPEAVVAIIEEERNVPAEENNSD